MYVVYNINRTDLFKLRCNQLHDRAYDCQEEIFINTLGNSSVVIGLSDSYGLDFVALLHVLYETVWFFAVYIMKNALKKLLQFAFRSDMI